MNVRNKYKISIDTYARFLEFMKATEDINGNVLLAGNDGGTDCCVNGKSMVGALYAMTFSDIWCLSDVDIYPYIKNFVI